jgi:16S rRNA (cytidine1402-2'-O)-methyltransferase
VSPGLYLVATPIGNLGDMSDRARATLAAANVIACEDTRVTARLLAAFGIARPMARYDEHTAERAGAALIERLKRGETVALVSDAGLPSVSDPGQRLVRAAIDAGVPVSVVPGPSAPLAALVVSGLPAETFHFAGFLPARGAARRAALDRLAVVPATLIFLETPPRLAASLADMTAVLGDREAAVARELTKLHEEVRRGTLAGLAAHYAAAAARGEIVVVVGPPRQDAAVAQAERRAGLDERLHAALATLSVRDAAAEVAAATGLPRREVYARALLLARAPRG